MDHTHYGRRRKGGNVASYADEFIARARNREKPTVRLQPKVAEAFLGQLAREGFEFAKECLDSIRDPELRRIIETIFFSTAAGAALGAVIGVAVAGPAGAQAGVVVGAGLGFVAACIAIVVTARQEDGPRGPELVLSVA